MIRTLIASAGLMMLVSCGGAEGHINDLEAAGMKGNIRLIEEEMGQERAHSYFSEQGFMDSSIRFKETETIRTEYIRNEENYIIKELTYRDDSLIVTSVYTYNDDFTESTETSDLTDAEVLHFYNKNGLLTGHEIVKEDRYSIKSVFTYNWNNSPDQKRLEMVRDGKESTETISYEYGSSDELISITRTTDDADSEREKKTEFKSYKFDDQGNWLERDMVTPSARKTVRRKIFYY